MLKTTASTEDTYTSASRHLDLRSCARRTASPDCLAIVLPRVVVFGSFLAVGVAKLVGVPEMAATFQEIGAGQRLGHVTGTLEVLCAIRLPTPAVACRMEEHRQ